MEAVIAKITKLRALAANAGTQAEAEAAAAAAERIIAQHQIDEAVLIMADPAREEALDEGAPLWEGTAVKVWLHMLAGGLARAHGCAVVMSKESLGRKTLKSQLRIAGAPKDVELVRYMFAWLSVDIDRLSRKEHGIAAINAFRVGAVAGVLNAMAAAQRTEIAARTERSSVAIMLVDRHDRSMAIFRSKANGKIRQGSGPSLHDAGAFDRGRKAGESMSNRHGLTAGEGRLALTSGRR
jgi:hypothetical protein